MKRIMAVGCSHGVYADPKALAAVVKFRDSFKPQVMLHLGDALDVTALRSGARGTPDEAAEIEPDIDGGVEFLRQLRPTHYLWGNHEDRLARLQNHPNAVISYAATQIANALNDVCRELRCQVLPYTGVYQGLTFGGVRYMHGVMYSENAVRDHAETFGNVVFAHTHRTGAAVGRRSDHPRGICVGTLSRMENMDYSKTRRASLSWSAGFSWGYFNDKHSQLWLHEQPRNLTEWQLPG